MAGVVSAASLMDEEVAVESITYKADDLTYDLGMLRADDGHPIDAEAFAADKEGYLHQLARENTQLLIKHIFELPMEQTTIGPVAVLPDITTRLPRSKPVPKPKPMTRWEKFAKEKGITKKRKSTMLFDEPSGEWAPRHGYGRKGDVSKDWAYELKKDDDPTVDHIERLELQKKQRVLKNKINQVSNIDRAARADAGRKGIALDRASTNALLAAPAEDSMVRPSKKDLRRDARLAGKKSARRGSDAMGEEGEGRAPLGKKRPVGIAPVPISEGKVDGVTGHGKQARLHAREDKGMKQERLALAQVSTASMGRFDTTKRGEPERPKDPRKLKRLPNELRAQDESKRHSDILRKVLGGSGEGEAESAPPRDREGGGGGDRAAGKKRKAGGGDRGAGGGGDRGKKAKRGR